MILATIAIAFLQVPDELRRFVLREDPSYQARMTDHTESHSEIRLTSQTWQGIEWNHQLTIDNPQGGKATETAVLVVTGDRVGSVDGPFSKELAKLSGLTVATLFDVPNQPIFDLREDDLIAHTFGLFLETQDSNWPLLFPMVKSAFKAMDAVQASTNGQVKRFVVTGASKRGWTTWLVGEVGDARVAGIAPMLFDNLNFVPQLKHQIELWGRYSPMIGAYSSSGLTEAVETDAGQRLVALMDPYNFLQTITNPILIVNGSNDPYWAVDAMSLYKDRLGPLASVLNLPNTGHSLRNPILIPSLAAFAADVASNRSLPTCELEIRDGEALVTGSGKSCRLWYAFAEDANFQESVWKPSEAKSCASPQKFTLPAGKGDLAVFGEVSVSQPGRYVSSQVKLLRQGLNR